MLRVWLGRSEWVAYLLLTVAFAVACFYLGQWQWSRHVEQQTKVKAIETNYTGTAKPLAEALPDGALPPEAQWTRVRVEGSYGGPDLFVRNRTLEQTVGFEVLTPFVTGGTTILVDRGWVPNAGNAETTPPADAAPAGAIAIVGWLRSAEPTLDRQLPAPQLASISLPQARGFVPELSPVEAYVVLGEQTPAPARGDHPVTPLPRPEEGLGPHQAYAYQWWLTMAAAPVIYLVLLRRTARAEQFGQVGQVGPSGPGDPSLGSPGAQGATKPRKVRIWDEEDA